MEIQLIRSATLRIKAAGKTMLVDPWLAAKGEGRSYAGEAKSPLIELPVPLEAVLSGIDAVVVSHLHSDHLDDAAISAIAPDLPLFAPPRDHEALRERGITNLHAVADEGVLGPIELTWTAGQHGPPEVLAEMGEVSGFLIRAPREPLLYWAGDTILCNEVRDVIAREKPDVIVVHACGATWGGVGPLVMDAAMVLEVLRLSGEAVVVATHLDAVDHATVSRQDLRNAIAREPALRDRLSLPEDGQKLQVHAAAQERSGPGLINESVGEAP